MKIKKLIINNFKGIEKFELNPDDKITNIYGDNATGKTTLFDAYLWLIVNKDSSGASDFEAKPIDKNGEIKHNLITSVECFFDIDLTLKKELCEKYQKNKSTKENEYVGDETTYYVNDLPVKMKEFNDKVIQIFGDFFRLLSDPFYFNSDAIKSKLPAWQERRKLLFLLCKNIEPERQFNNNTPDNAKKIINSDLAKLNKLLENIPARIDENKLKIINNLPDLEQINKEIKEEENKLLDIESALNKKTNTKREEFQKELQKQNLEYNKVIVKINEKIKVENQEIIKFNQEIENEKQKVEKQKRDIAVAESDIKSIKERIDSARAEFIAIRDTQYDHALKICTMCGQKLPDDIIKNSVENFEKNKAEKLAKINQKGAEYIEIKNKFIKRLESLKSEESKQNNTGGIQKDLIIPDYESEPEYISIKNKIAELQKLITESVEPNNEDVINEKNIIKSRIAELQNIVNQHAQNAILISRVAELNAEYKNIISKISTLQQQLSEIEDYILARVNKLSEEVNKNFTLIKFKLFETQKNGNIAECCVAQIDTNGSLVEYTQANHAGKTNAGLEIIKVFSNHFNINLPIFIDFRESVTKIIDIKNQVINLIKDEQYKKLEIK